jgi:hypothetical protein
MTLTSAGSHDRRTLVVGAMVISGLIAVSKGLPLVRAWAETRVAEAASASASVAFADEARRMLPALRDSLRVRRARAAFLDSSLLVGLSPSDLVATLSSTVEDLASESGVRVNAVQMKADTVAHGPLSTVSVRVTGIADVTGLAGLLHAIEGDSHPLVIRSLAVSQSEPAAPGSKPEQLRLDIVVEGLGLIRAGKGP